MISRLRGGKEVGRRKLGLGLMVERWSRERRNAGGQAGARSPLAVDYLLGLS